MSSGKASFSFTSSSSSSAAAILAPNENLSVVSVKAGGLSVVGVTSGEGPRIPPPKIDVVDNA
jgi:hypothetical protein